MVFKIHFYDYDYDLATISNETFSSELEAENFIDDIKCDHWDISIDEDGNDYWKEFITYYYNKENFHSYSIEKV